MAVITITLPDDLNSRLVAAVCAVDGYTPTIPDPDWMPTVPDKNGGEMLNPESQKQIKNPMTPKEFVVKQLTQWGRNYLDAHRPEIDLSEMSVKGCLMKKSLAELNAEDKAKREALFYKELKELVEKYKVNLTPVASISEDGRIIAQLSITANYQ